MVKILNGFTSNVVKYHKNPTHMVVECTDVQITDRWELHLVKIIHLENKHLDGNDLHIFGDSYCVDWKQNEKHMFLD